MRTLLLLVTAIGFCASASLAEPPPGDDVVAAIARMRDDMVDAFNKGDVDRMLSHVTEDAVVTWQNAELCTGRAEIKAYYTKMMTGPDRVVQSVSSAPTVDGRIVHDGWAVSWGRMNDHFKLTDGRELAMDSRFTAVTLKTEAGWKVQAFHLSTDAFHGAIITTAISTTARWVGASAGVGGLAVGMFGGVMLARRRRRAHP